MLSSAILAQANHPSWFPHQSWSELVAKDLSETADIKVERIDSREQAEELVRTGRRAAVLVLAINLVTAVLATIPSVIAYAAL